MPIKNYGVWVAKPVRVSAERAEEDPKSPHIHLFYDDGSSGGNFNGARRASINVKSKSALSELVFWLIRDFQHPIVDKLRDLDVGFHDIPSQLAGLALDYIRGNLMELRTGSILPHDQPGGRDDIIDYVMPELESAINRGATIYLFGEPYEDKQGIHNIHMNQGSQAEFKKFNGVWQDGGVLIYFPDADRFDAIFLAFASQAVHTDEITGHSLSGSQNFAQLIRGEVPDDETRITDDMRVAIIAALVNPIDNENQPGATGKPEKVYLLNRLPQAIGIKGWSLLNSSDTAYTITDDITLAPGEVKMIEIKGVPLTNKGGLISLLDNQGIKVDGVSYTKNQASKEGEVVIFR
ncbi:YukJ family protein [Trichocoleus desertorum AS-A10]|uniref:DUF2278 family protein n=1 Tax=Trichocoleus desertorum TaxID=1481672 RepID=UPI003299C583